MKTKSLHTVNNVFLCQLAFIDITKASLVLPFKCYFQFKAKQLLTETFCQLTAFVSSFTYLHSSSLLAMIAIIRYFKIIKPFKFGQVFSTKKVILYSTLLVLVSFSVSLLPIIGLGRYKFSMYHGVCFADWSAVNTFYRTLFYVFTIGLNYPVLIISYGKIFLALKQHRKLVSRAINRDIFTMRHGRNEETKSKMADRAAGNEMRSLQIIEDDRRTESKRNAGNKTRRVRFVDASDAQEVIERSESMLGPSPGRTIEEKLDENARENHSKLEFRKFKNEIEVTKVMFIVFIAYSLCWLPAFFVNIFMLTQLVEVSPTVLFTIVTLVELKVFLNPLIYGIWNSQFRKALKQLLLEEFRVGPA